jgi:endonuclease/exonuclease/phosphatase family metal-dependent hydrolase
MNSSSLHREDELQTIRILTFNILSAAHVLVLGDFNDDSDSASVRFWTGRQSLEGYSVAYLDAWDATHPADAGPTFSPANPLVRAGQMPLELGRRIDYIMIRSGIHGPTLAVADCQRVLDEPVNGVWASDHFGVITDLEVPAHAPWNLVTTSTSDDAGAPHSHQARPRLGSSP